MLTDDVKKLKKDFKKRLVNDIEIFQKKIKTRQYSPECYINLSEEERNKKHQYGREQFRTLLEDEK